MARTDTMSEQGRNSLKVLLPELSFTRGRIVSCTLSGGKWAVHMENSERNSEEWAMFPVRKESFNMAAFLRQNNNKKAQKQKIIRIGV